MGAYEDAEKEMLAATARLTKVQTSSWDGHGSSGSHERAAAMNRAELPERLAILAAVRKMAQIDRTRYPAEQTMEVISRLEEEISRTRANIERYGGAPH